MHPLHRIAAAATLLVAPLTTLAHEWHAHSDQPAAFTEELRQRILAERQADRSAFAAAAKSENVALPAPTKAQPLPARATDLFLGFERGKAASAWAVPPSRQAARHPLLASAALSPMSFGMNSLSFGALALLQPPAGNGALMSASFSPFRPRVRSYNDGTYFYIEGDNVPDPALMPSPMVGITAWQQQIPLPVSYFFGTTNPENNVGSLGYGQPNVWRLPLVPTPAASPISLNGNFLRGAVAVAANGIAIFNPRNNRGEYSYAIGELDQYGGHCGLADDYHYHIAPVHLQSVLGVDKPVAWALDGYPIYGFTEPDGSAQQALDADGGHNHGSWGYHYHARGTVAGGHVAPYLMDAMHGQVVNFGGQVDPQPEVQSMRASGTGGYEAKAVDGAVITAFLNPVAFSTDGSGHFVHNPSGAPSSDQYLMRYTVGAATYDICWRINRNVNPKTLTITFRHPTTGTTTTTYTNGTNNRLKAYPMAAWSMTKLPDTGATQDGSSTFGEDADYTINPPSFTDHGDGTITDNVTGLMWQKTDNGESTWDAALTNAASVATGGYTDWRLPTPAEAFSILNHASNPALNLTYFPSHPAGAAEYWWTSDIFGTDATRVWCTNAGGGLGAHPKAETLSAGGSLRFHARYVRGAKPTNAHNYLNNNDGTITDLDTGLMWTQVPSSAMNWNSALAYAEGLATAGYTDWRLPNVKELQTLVDITLANSTSSATAQSCLQRNLFPAATATAYWSSTPLRSGGGSPTQAWLVEFGVNTTSNPPRNSQGIVSYEPFGSSYPVFAVRTTSVQTQIAISQAGSTLTDGVSTVGYNSPASKTFTITNTGATSLVINGVTIDGPDAARFNLVGVPANGTTIPANGSLAFDVQFSAASAGSYAAALHIANSDTAVGAAFDINLSGTIPVIGSVATSPTAPSNADAPFVTAKITPTAGTTTSLVQLTYNVGTQTTNTVFNETMSSTATATGGWDGTGAVFPWTVVTQAGAGNVKQTTASNHTPAGQGGTCGLEMSKGSATATQTMVTTTNAINTSGLSGYVEFYTTTANVVAGQGWIFQVSPDGGTTWNTRASDIGGTAHSAFALTHYDLAPAELTSNLKIRFQIIGNGVGGATGTKVQIDDIVIKTVTGNPAVTLTMFDDGQHGDGAAGDGVYGVQLPAFAAGSNVTFSIAATNNLGVVTTLASAGSYTTTLPLSITTTSPLANALTSAPYTQTLAATGGTPGYSWSVTAGALPPGITLGSNGAFSGTATAAGTYNFTVTATDSVGHTASRPFALTTKTPPNIVVIVTDDQGWGDIGYHTAPGQVPIQTPTMDSFATSGIRLEKFYPTAVCSVTRACLLTGRNTIRNGTNNERGLNLSEHIMPQTFKAAGYQTYMCGKWHLGGSDKNLHYTTVNGQSVRVIQEGLEYAPYNRGWDSHYGQYSGAIDYFTHRSAEADNLDIPDWWLNGVQQDGPSEHTDSQGHGGWSPDLLADKAVSHIQNRDPAKPLLLYVAFNSIHGPVSAPQSLITKYQSLGITDPNRRLIAAAVDGMDQAMGRVLTALDTAGIANNTIVVFFSDNGGDESKGSINDPLRGTKTESYEGAMHTPAGIRWPGVLPSGIVSNQYVWVGDLFPTLCAASGVTPQNTKPLDGLNLWPALLAASNTSVVQRPAPLVTVTGTPTAFDTFTDPVNGGSKVFKLIRTPGTPVTNQLFNMDDDPYETTDLLLGGNAAAYAGIVTSLTTAITNIAVENYPPYIGPPLIANTVAQGGTIELYAPFTSYKAPSVQWRKNGVNLTDGGNVSGATGLTQVTDSLGAPVAGAYTTKLTLTNVSSSDAATYDVVITNVGGSTTSALGALTVVVGSPVIATPATFTKGTSQTLTWPAIATATGYAVQMSATADFASILATQSPTTPTATFTGLTSGSTYYFRATATDGITTSAFSNVVSSTQDAGNPAVTITAPTDNTLTAQVSVNVQGTAVDTISGVASVTVNGVTATTTDNFAHWSATVPLSVGSNTLTVTALDNAQSGGNAGVASINVTLAPNAPVISSIKTGPTTPTFLDNVWVTALVQASPGAPVSNVQLTYDVGVPITTARFRESFANTSSNSWNGSGALNPWTTVGGGTVRQAIGPSNNTTPISLAGCTTSTVSGTTTVTCASTAKLWPGMLVTGPGIPGSINGTQTGNTTIGAITDGTHFVLSQPVPADASGITIVAAGAALTNCVTNTASTSVTCDSTAGLVNGMALTGTGLANNATVQTVTSATTFTMNAAPTTASAPGAIAITAAGAAAEFNGGTANVTGSMFATTNTINTSGNSGYVEFSLQTRDLAATNNNGWAFQISTNGGTTWTTPASLKVSTDSGATFTTLASDGVDRSESWNASTVNLTNGVVNSAGSTAGSTTVTCASTVGLSAGRAVAGPNVYVTGGTTQNSATVTCTNTTGLAVGMALQGAGIPNNSRIGTLTPNVSFTMVTGASPNIVAANATATASVAIVGTYFPPNALVGSITDATTFVLNTPAYVNTSSVPIAISATTVNHGFRLYHYDLAPTEVNANIKLRFQCAGYTPTQPTRSPRVSVDDILVATTTLPAPIAVTMYDDGLHGDGAAGDQIYGAAIPVQAAGTPVSFRINATDSNGGTTTSANSSFTVASSLTDATIKNAEFLGMPTDRSVAVNVVANTDQYAYIEYGTAPGAYTAATPITLFSVDATKPEYYNPIEITIPNLQPDTEYYYRVRHRDTTASTFKSRGERSFHTARPRGTSFVFTVTADPHLDVNSDLPLFLRAMNNIAADGPDLHIDLGDIFMTDKMADGITGIPPEFFGGVFPNQSRVNDRALFFRNQFERCCHSVPFFYTQGNHESEYGYLFNAAADKQNNIPAWNLKARKAFYPTPVPDSFYTGNPTPMDYTGGTLGLLENYYAFEWGDALFITLDPFWNTVVQPGGQNNDAWNWTLGKTQYDWLKATLQNSSARYKFVFMHHIVGGSTTLADGTTPNIAARGGIEVADKYEWGGKNADGTDGFATKRPGWDMPIHNLLVANKVNVVFHGHDHLYAYQTLDGLVYLECPQPGTANYTQFGSAGDGKYTQGVLLPNSGHIRVTVTPNQALAEYVRAYRPEDENTTRHNQDVSHSFSMAPRIFAPVEITAKAPAAVSFRWNAVPNKPYAVQWSPDLINWTTFDTVTFPAVFTNGTYTDTNPARAGQPRGFYRVSFTP